MSMGKYYHTCGVFMLRLAFQTHWYINWNMSIISKIIWSLICDALLESDTVYYLVTGFLVKSELRSESWCFFYSGSLTTFYSSFNIMYSCLPTCFEEWHFVISHYWMFLALWWWRYPIWVRWGNTILQNGKADLIFATVLVDDNNEHE